MIISLDTLDVFDKNKHYEIYKYNGFICYLQGYIFCAGKKSGSESVKEILNQYAGNGTIDFNMFYGAYRVFIIDNNSNQIIFFNDNAGNSCYYYSINENIISDSFLELSSKCESLVPNYDAITQFIHFNCIFSEETICEQIFRTEAEFYYTYRDSRIVRIKKNLKLWDTNKKYKNLHQFMDDLVCSAKGLKIASVITGGTDSRTVLSHLIALKAEFDLVISGRAQMVDVQIAKRIASHLDLPIYISDESVDAADSNWLKELFIKTDGVYGTFSLHRLYKMGIMLKQMGIQLKIGGVAGELYKNSFLNQDFPFYNYGESNTKKFYRLKINPAKFSSSYFTGTILSCKTNMEDKIIKNLFSIDKDKKRNEYFKAGAKSMKYRIITQSNSENLSISSISPFVEPEMMKLTYNANPWRLETNKWQRKEVSTYCKEIADIKTDRGLTLLNSKLQILKEFILTYLFLFKVGLKRTVFKKKQKNKVNRLESFVKGRKLLQFKLSMERCKELNILAKNIDIDDIPDILADRLMTIGLVFMKYAETVMDTKNES